jgi:hypothetical protein
MGGILQFAPNIELEIGPIGLIPTYLLLTVSGLDVYPIFQVMSQSLYRHYYYYGPLSTGRDGQAMGCRRVLTK